jgi:hypothetical protein
MGAAEMTNLLKPEELKPSTNITAPKGYSVAVSRDSEHTTVRIYEGSRLCNSLMVLGDVESVFPSDDNKSVGVYVTKGPLRYFAKFATDLGFGGPTPYIPAFSREGGEK